MIHSSISHSILSYLTGKTQKLELTNQGDGCWIGFSSGAPTVDGANFNEPDPVTYPSYSRIRLNLHNQQATKFVDIWGDVGEGVDGNAKPGCVTNKTEFTSPECKEDGGWPTFTHFGLFTSQTGGKPIASDRLTDPEGEFNEETQRYPDHDLTVHKGEVAVFRKGALELRFV